MGDSPITFGQVLAMASGLAAFTAIVTFAWRGGAHSAEVKALEKSTNKSVSEFKQSIEDLRTDLRGFINDFNLTRGEWREWRGATEQRLVAAESEIERRRDQYHNEIAPKLQKVLGFEPRIERLEEAKA